MNVRELITRLQELPQEANVVLCDESEGTEWKMESAELFTYSSGEVQVELR